MRFRAILIIFVILLMSANPICSASAEEQPVGEWARVTDNNVNLYATEYNSKVICVLEKSYYLRIMETRSEMLLVSIMGSGDFPMITGYVWKSEVKLIDEQPALPYYPTEKITVSADSAVLKLSPTPNAETLIIATNTQKLCYYGKITAYGTKWYYVYYCGKFGYVDSDSVTNPNIVLHPTPIETPAVNPITPTDPNESDDPKQEKPVTATPTAEILLAVFVVLLAVGLTLALFLPGNSKKKSVFEQDI